MEHFTTGSPFWANSHCTKRTCNGGLWYMMAGCLSCAGLGAEYLITLLDAAKTGCSALFLYSFCSWSSQGQTWICPWLFGKSVRQISWKLDAVKLHLLNRCWLHSLERPSWTHFLAVWGTKSRRTEILSAKEPRNWEVNCSSNSELTTMNSTSSSSGPLFVTLTVSHSWHRNNPPALCWWEQNRIFVGALWGSTLDEAMF